MSAPSCEKCGGEGYVEHFDSEIGPYGDVCSCAAGNREMQRAHEAWKVWDASHRDANGVWMPHAKVRT